ncbi:MAG: hypothetical protein HFG29_02940 [Eubacterium sp.]|nr:hypothetical protein [Eubacterium sp.]
MKKNILVLIATLILTFSFATTCFAKVSPTGDVKPTDEQTTADGNSVPNNPNGSDKSPKTGVETAIPMIALITAAGVMLVAKKEYAKAN